MTSARSSRTSDSTEPATRRPSRRVRPRPTPAPTVLARSALAGDSLAAARVLLGAHLVREDETGRRVGRIAEVEAYVGPDDRASHAHVGPTDRNRVMFGPPGVAYVYLVYGMHHCLNVVTEVAGRPAAILVRAVTPLEGVAAMRAARVAAGAPRRPGRAPGPAPDPAMPTGEIRGGEARRIEALDATRLASGPGLVAAAFGLDRTWTGHDLCDPSSALRIELPRADDRARGEPRSVVAAPRIGIDRAGEPWVSLPWRLYLADEPSVSTARRAGLRGTRPPATDARRTRPAGDRD